MKEIRAYIHNHRIADVVRALKESGLCNTDGKPGCRNLVVVPIKVLFKAMGASEQHYSIELAEVMVNEFKLGWFAKISRWTSWWTSSGTALASPRLRWGGFTLATS